MRLSIKDLRVFDVCKPTFSGKKIQVKAKTAEAEETHRKVRALGLCNVSEMVIKNEGLILSKGSVEASPICEFFQSECNSRKLARNRTRLVCARANC